MNNQSMLSRNKETFDDRRVILEFFEWPEARRISLDFDNVNTAEFELLDNRKSGRLLDLYFGIDATKLEEERRQLLDSMTSSGENAMVPETSDRASAIAKGGA